MIDNVTIERLPEIIVVLFIIVEKENNIQKLMFVQFHVCRSFILERVVSLDSERLNGYTVHTALLSTSSSILYFYYLIYLSSITLRCHSVIIV